MRSTFSYRKHQIVVESSKPWDKSDGMQETATAVLAAFKYAIEQAIHIGKMIPPGQWEVQLCRSTVSRFVGTIDLTRRVLYVQINIEGFKAGMEGRSKKCKGLPEIKVNSWPE